MKEAVLVAGARTAVGRAPKGALRTSRPDDMAAAAITEALRRAPGLDPAEVEDVILGCAIPEGSQGMNVARLSALRAGLPEEVPAQTVNRFCSSGLQTIALRNRLRCPEPLACAWSAVCHTRRWLFVTTIRTRVTTTAVYFQISRRWATGTPRPHG